MQANAEFQPLDNRPQRYLDLLGFIISNAVAGELVAIDNYCSMATMKGLADEKIGLLELAVDESKHVRVLQKLGKINNFGVMDRVIEPQWLEVREMVAEKVAEGDFLSALIMQDLLIETMAVTLYKVLGQDTDENTAKIAGNLLMDEEEHTEFGLTRFRAFLAADRETTQRKMKESHYAVMPVLLSMLSTSCHTLCDELNVDCGSLKVEDIDKDIDELRIAATDVYMDVLERSTIDANLADELIQSLPSFIPAAPTSERISCCA